ncbi:MAG: stalk domain-containing protein [Bacillota bacterium]
MRKRFFRMLMATVLLVCLSFGGAGSAVAGPLDLGGLLRNLTGVVGGVVEDAGDLVAEAGDVGLGAVQKVIGVAGGLVGDLGAVTGNLVQEVGTVAGTVVGVAGKVAADLTTVTGEALGAIVPGDNPVGAALDSVETLLETTGAAVDGLTGGTAALLGGVTNAAGDAVAGLTEGVAGVLETTGDVVTAIGEATTGLVDGLTGTVGGMLDNLGDTVTDVVSTLPDTGALLPDGPGDALPPVPGTGGTVVPLPPVLPDQKVKITVTFRVGDSVLYINGKAVGRMDVAPYIKANRCFLPARYVAYTLGLKPGDIHWDQSTRTATLSGTKTTVRVTVGSQTIYVNDKPVTIDVAPELVRPGRVMLPYRWVAEPFGATVNWEPGTRTVTIEYYL